MLEVKIPGLPFNPVIAIWRMAQILLILGSCKLGSDWELLSGFKITIKFILEGKFTNGDRE